jgi:hypothetical protein
MRWANIVRDIGHINYRALSDLMAVMWKLSADSGNYTLMHTLSTSTLDPLGVAISLDFVGIVVPEDIMQIIGA